MRASAADDAFAGIAYKYMPELELVIIVPDTNAWLELAWQNRVLLACGGDPSMGLAAGAAPAAAAAAGGIRFGVLVAFTVNQELEDKAQGRESCECQCGKRVRGTRRQLRWSPALQGCYSASTLHMVLTCVKCTGSACAGAANTLLTSQVLHTTLVTPAHTHTHTPAHAVLPSPSSNVAPPATLPPPFPRAAAAAAAAQTWACVRAAPWP